MKGHKDLRLVAALAPLCAVLALLIPVEGISLAFALPPTLILPGYAITAAAFAGRSLGRPQTLLFSIALSLATLVLGGLVLNYLGGIHPGTWAVLLVLVVLLCCRVAAVRRGPVRAERSLRRPRIARVEAVVLVLALVAAVAAIALADAPRPAERAIGYTQLWILPKAGSGETEARVGVRSQQQAPEQFDLRVRVGGDGVVRRSFRLDPGETGFLLLRAPTDRVGRVPVIATLLRHNRPFSVYRRVKGSLVAPPQSR